MRSVPSAALYGEFSDLQICMGGGGLDATALLTPPPPPHSLSHWEAPWTGEQRARVETFPGLYPEQAVAVPRRSQRVATTPHPGSLCN